MYRISSCKADTDVTHRWKFAIQKEEQRMFLSVGERGVMISFCDPRIPKNRRLKIFRSPPFRDSLKNFRPPPFDFKITPKAIKTLENIEFWWFEIKIFLVNYLIYREFHANQESEIGFALSWIISSYPWFYVFFIFSHFSNFSAM